MAVELLLGIDWLNLLHEAAGANVKIRQHFVYRELVRIGVPLGYSVLLAFNCLDKDGKMECDIRTLIIW